MRIVAVFFVLATIAMLCGGCVHPLPPQPPFVSTVPACDSRTPMPRQEDVCEGRFTREKLACVKCIVPEGCMFADAVVYCAPSCEDRACSAVGR
jgi:hypothetical protein